MTNTGQMMATKFGMKSPLEVVERVIQKVVLLLEKWPGNHEILEKNLGSSGLFTSLVTGNLRCGIWPMTSGWTSSKLMGKSAVVTSLIKSHASINPGEDLRNHVAFYKALGRLLFTVYNEDSTFFDFVRPWQDTFSRLQVKDISEILICQAYFSDGAGRKDDKEAHMKLQFVLEDIRGLVSAALQPSGMPDEEAAELCRIWENLRMVCKWDEVLRLVGITDRSRLFALNRRCLEYCSFGFRTLAQRPSSYQLPNQQRKRTLLVPILCAGLNQLRNLHEQLQCMILHFRPHTLDARSWWEIQIS